MKIFMPNKMFLKFSLILLPFNLVLVLMVVISILNKNETLLNLATVLLLLMILVFSVGSRIIRKDNVILTNDAVSYGLKDKNTSYLKMLLLQVEKDSIRFVDIINQIYSDENKTLTMQTRQGIKTIQLKYFTKKVIGKIVTHISERTKNG